MNVDRWMEKAKNRIKAIGIEVEGGWDSPTAAKAIMRDGSVVFPQVNTNRYGEPVAGSGYPRYIGEIASPILTVGEGPEWMKKWYPKYVNETCGLHVHMSFSTMRYYHLLLCPQYTDAMFDQLAKWALDEELPKSHPMWTRLSGTHKHCVKTFRGDEQVKQTRKIWMNTPGACRYTAINYPQRQHATVECRLLAMMDTHQQGWRGIQRVLATTNAFLLAVTRKEPRAVVQVPYTAGADEFVTIYA
jgi:hypothetical protein